MPGKIAHLVPVQRFDSFAMKKMLSEQRPSDSNYHMNSTTKLSPNSIAPNQEVKTSMDDSLMADWPPPPPFSASPNPAPASASNNSLKLPYEESKTVNNNTHNRASSQTRLQTNLSRFQRNVELIPFRQDMTIKRSSV